MNRLFNILIFVSLFTVSCRTEKTENIDDVIKPEFKYSFPVLVDTFDFKVTVKVQEEFGTANYHPFYFGVKKDTIFINYKLPQYSIPPPSIFELSDTASDPHAQIEYKRMDSNYKEYSDYFQETPDDEYMPWDSAIFEIEVDTTQIILNIDFGNFQDSTFAFKALPVIIENKMDKKNAVGYGSHIALILEAKNENGIWKAIERQYIYSCGMGLPTILVPPNELVLTSVPFYQGDFKTDLRLKLGENYSDIFKGNIDLRQFEKE